MAERCILLVDDEEKIVEAVASYLARAGFSVVSAGTGEEALRLFRARDVALVLLDLMLPDIGGEVVCERIRQSSNVPILMMTAKVDEESIVGGLRIGADDYITKPFSPRELVARVEAALRRAAGMGDAAPVLSDRGLTVRTEERLVTRDGVPISLTPNEYGILVLLMSRPRKVFTREEIILSIKSEAFDGYDRAIDSHIKNLRQKIEQNPKEPKWIRTVYGVGYRFGGGAS